MQINTYDLDGVIYMGPGRDGLTPGPNDHIITGRSFEERQETIAYLNSRGIHNHVHMNPVRFDEKSRISSGQHKGKKLIELENAGYTIGIHFEDDPIQMEEINKIVPHIQVVLLVHDLVNKENVKHDDWETE